MGYGRAVMWGMVAAMVTVALAVVGVVFVLPGLRSPMEVPGDRVMVVVAGRGGADGSQVAQLIGVLDASKARLTLELVDPMTKVAVPGTSYDRLRDAYPFGGGEGVSEAWGQARAVSPLPVVSVSQDVLVETVDAMGGIIVDVPYEASVFDGERLTVFQPGSRRMNGTEVAALLESAEYRKETAEQMAVRSSVASGVAEAFQEMRPRIRGLSSSLSDADLDALGSRLSAIAGTLTLVPAR